MTTDGRLLVVDDDRLHRTIYSKIALKTGFSVNLASSLEEARDALRDGHFQCILLDLRLGENTGAEVLKIISLLRPKPHVLLVSGAGQDTVQSAMRYGADLGVDIGGWIAKPVNVAVLRFHLDRVQNAIDSSASDQKSSAERHIDYSI
jgi:DNA-binding NtrC family response regulator